ncbi:phage tail domain-containing protein ['Paenibacillus yunnanensis' Narsing Rao et al. 2020]|uniref:phage tail domain-containing protein n=1 Tax=Paenibacillus tengchongensis TaxID=2608684 RepID=UPI00124C0CF1|nr:phage tail domain-containing protein [Paenibacillus tengchongensis]
MLLDVNVNGIWLSTVGAALYERRLPVLPETEENTVKIPGRDGVLDYGFDYGARPLGLTFEITSSAADYSATVANLARIFNSRRGTLSLEFNDMPDKKYRCVYAGTLQIGATGSRLIDVNLRMNDSWPESAQDTALHYYGEGLTVGNGYFYTDHAFAITASGQTFTVNNAGTNDAYPLIRITGAWTNLSLSDGESTIVLTGSAGPSDVVEIDCAPDKQTVRKNGANAYGISNGVFPALLPGETEFTVTGAGLSVTIAFVYRYKYLY